MIEIQNLSKSFGKLEVLKEVHLRIPPGEITGLIGKNGAGKTTLFRCLAGLEDFEGNIAWKQKDGEKHIGLLPTSPPMLSRITGWEYLKLLTSARDIRIDNFEAQNIFELPLNDYAENYSTGMKKKLALTGLLLQRNQVFLLDEPFNGVDLEGNLLMVEMLKLLKAKGKTILIASHILGSLLEIADHVHLLDDGRISEMAGQGDFDRLNEMIRADSIGDKLKALRID